jgi:enamine deaminase RidA (YjgF/YER057c/UK114 family)
MSPVGGSVRTRTAPGAGAESGRSGAAKIVTSRFVSPRTIDLHLGAAPSEDRGSFTRQASSIYASLQAELRSLQAAPRDVVAEKVFLSDLPSQVRDLRSLRQRFYETSRTGAHDGPAVTYVQQPPARPGRLCEVQLTVLLPRGEPEFVSRPVEGLPAGATGRIVESARGAREIFLSGLTGGSRGDGRDLYRQASAAFRRAEECLHNEGFSFHNVVRTWIYLDDIDRDYAALNRARREFFRSRGIHVPPASTGIRGSIWPSDRICGVDLRAVASGGGGSVRAIHAPTLNEAPSYGADFSRGMRVDHDDRAVLHISGTASIDPEGQVVGPGDIEGQVDRMLLNVEQLLADQGAGYGDLASAVTYLKRPRDLDAFNRVAGRRGFPTGIPHSIVVADVCRPEWLCEIETMAVLV